MTLFAAGPAGEVAQLLEVGVPVVVSPDLASRPVTLSLDAVTPGAALEAFAQAAGGSVSVSDGVAVISSKRGRGSIALSARPPGDPGQLVTILERVYPDEIAIAPVGPVLVLEGSPRAVRGARDIIAASRLAAREMVVEVVAVEASAGALSAFGLDNSASAAGEVRVFDGAWAPSGDFGASIVARFEASASSDSARVRSSVVLRLVDGGSATFQDGQDVPVIRRTVSDTGTVTDVGFDLIRTGVLLSVTASSLEEGFVRLDLVPEISSVVRIVDGVPLVSRRTLQSSAQVRPGDVIILGGFESDRASQSLAGLIGGLRRSDRSASRVFFFLRVQEVV